MIHYSCPFCDIVCPFLVQILVQKSSQVGDGGFLEPASSGLDGL